MLFRSPMTAAAEVNRVVQRHRLKVPFLPKALGGLVAVGSGLVQCVLGLAQDGILRGDDLPSERREPWFHAPHRSRMLLGLAGGFRLLQFSHARTLEVALARLGVDRICREAVLHSQTFRHQFLEERIVQELRCNGRFHARQHTSFPCPEQ